jgi:hypothetical protein
LDGEYIFLQTVLDDLTDQGQRNPLLSGRTSLTLEPRLSTTSLEAAITSRIALDESQTPFHYLLGAWKRAVSTSRSIRADKDKEASEKLKIIAEIRRLCVSYAGFSIMIPDMFGYYSHLVSLCSRQKGQLTTL